MKGKNRRSQAISFHVIEETLTIDALNTASLREAMQYLENTPGIRHLALAQPPTPSQLQSIQSHLKNTQVTALTLAGRYQGTALRELYDVLFQDTHLQSYHIDSDVSWQEGNKTVSAHERFAALSERNRALASARVPPAAEQKSPTQTLNSTSQSVWQKLWEELLLLWRKLLHAQHPPSPEVPAYKQMAPRNFISPPISWEERVAFFKRGKLFYPKVLSLQSSYTPEKVINSQAKKLLFALHPDKHLQWTEAEKEQASWCREMIVFVRQALLANEDDNEWRAIYAEGQELEQKLQDREQQRQELHQKKLQELDQKRQELDQKRQELDQKRQELDQKRQELDQKRQEQDQIIQALEQRLAEQTQAEQGEQPGSQSATGRLANWASRQARQYFFPSKQSATYSSLPSESASEESLEETTESGSLLASSQIQQKM